MLNFENIEFQKKEEKNQRNITFKQIGNLKGPKIILTQLNQKQAISFKRGKKSQTPS